MIKTTKRIVLHGESLVDGIAVANIRAEVDCEHPERICFDTSQADVELYKANREQAHADFAEFEDMAYALQDEMLASVGLDAGANQTAEIPADETEETNW